MIIDDMDQKAEDIYKLFDKDKDKNDNDNVGKDGVNKCLSYFEFKVLTF